MMEKKTISPDFGYVDFDSGRPEGLPKPKVVRCGTKNRNHAPIKVKRTIRTGVRVYQPGEPIDWAKAYDEHSVYFQMELISEDAMLML